MNAPRFLVLFALFLCASCAHAPRFAVVEAPDRKPTAYLFPPDRPAGTVRVTPGPFTEVGASSVENRIFVVDVRMSVRNASDQPWTIDPASQRIDVNGGSGVEPSYVSIQSGPASTPRTITVPPFSDLVVDFLYPVPQRPNPVYGFGFAWNVHDSDSELSATTEFKRTG